MQKRMTISKDRRSQHSSQRKIVLRVNVRNDGLRDGKCRSGRTGGLIRSAGPDSNSWTGIGNGKDTDEDTSSESDTRLTASELIVRRSVPARLRPRLDNGRNQRHSYRFDHSQYSSDDEEEEAGEAKEEEEEEEDGSEAELKREEVPKTAQLQSQWLGVHQLEDFKSISDFGFPVLVGNEVTHNTSRSVQDSVEAQTDSTAPHNLQREQNSNRQGQIQVMQGIAVDSDSGERVLQCMLPPPSPSPLLTVSSHHGSGFQSRKYCGVGLSSNDQTYFDKFFGNHEMKSGLSRAKTNRDNCLTSIDPLEAFDEESIPNTLSFWYDLTIAEQSKRSSNLDFKMFCLKLVWIRSWNDFDEDVRIHGSLLSKSCLPCEDLLVNAQVTCRMWRHRRAYRARQTRMAALSTVYKTNLRSKDAGEFVGDFDEKDR